MPIDVLSLLQSNQNQLDALSNQQQAFNPVASNQTLQLSVPHTGQPIDALGRIGAFLQSQNNDRIMAEQAQQQADQAKQAQADKIAREDSLLAQKQKNALDLLDAKQKIELAKEKAKATKALESATRKVDILIRQGRIDPANREDQIKLMASGATGTVKPSGKGLGALGQGLSDISEAVLGKKARNDTEKGLISTFSLDSSIKAMDNAAKSLPDKFWTIPGRIGSSIDNFASKVFGGRPAAGRGKFVDFLRTTNAAFDTYRSKITGAQASARELAILATRMPVADGTLNFDSKADYFAKLDSLNRFNDAAKKRQQALLRDGIRIVSQPGDDQFIGTKDGKQINLEVSYPISQFLTDMNALGKEKNNSSNAKDAPQNTQQSFPVKLPGGRFAYFNSKEDRDAFMKEAGL